MLAKFAFLLVTILLKKGNINIFSSIFPKYYNFNIINTKFLTYFTSTL